MIVTCFFAEMASAAFIEFPIDKTTDYEVETKGNLLSISFNKPIADKLAIDEPLSSIVASQDISGDKKKIAITTTSPLSTRNYRRNGHLVIEVEPRKDNLSDKGIDAANQAVNIEYGNHDTFSRFVFSSSKKPAYNIKTGGSNTTIRFLSKINITSPNLKNYPRAAEIMKADNHLGGIDITFPNSMIQSFEHKNKIVLDIANPGIAPQIAMENIHKTEPIVISSEKKVSRNAQMALSQIIPQNEQHKVASLSFSWNIPVNLAVFNRGGYIWVAFDHRQNVNVEELRSLSSDLADELIQIPHPSATVLRIKPKDNVHTSIRKEGLLWIVDLLTQQTKNDFKEMTVFTQYDSLKQPYLFIPTTAAGNTVTIIDPEIGDLIAISPTSEVKQGLSAPYNYPDFDLLDSTQGLAMVFKAHDISLNRSNTGINIKALNRGLNISPDLETLKRHEFLARQEDTIPAFVSDIPDEILKHKYLTAVGQLQQDILTTPDGQKDAARLMLAKYYLSQGLGTEALSVLNKMVADKSPEIHTEKMQGLFGVANFLAKRYEQAVENFSYGKLPEMNEAIFWRTLASAAREPKAGDNVTLLSYISLIKDYPAELKNKIAVVGAEAALKAGDDMSAQNFIDVLRTTESKHDYEPEISYLTARKLMLQGYPRNAIREFRRAAGMNSLKYSSLARKHIINLETELSAIKLDKALGELERLRFAWGEKEFRKSLLSDLSTLYVRNNDYYNAMRSMQNLYNLSNKDEQPLIIEQMVSLFEDIYLNNRADNLPPLKSLALYHDFEWLAPKSSHYTEIVQKLSDRLVAVDLLDRAEDLLLQQLKYARITPKQKGTIGTRLALIYLFKEQSHEALEILNETETSAISPATALYRKIIKARALSNLKRQDEALELLKDDYSRNAILLKSEIFWNAGLWGAAADSIKYLIEKPIPGKPLSQEQISLILDWATALKKSGRETVIVRLRNKFMPYFKDTKYYSAFSILTNRLENDKVDIKAIDNVVNDVEAFSNFARIYNDALRADTMGKIDENQ